MTTSNFATLTLADYNTVREGLRAYFASNPRFADYDFDGSNLSVLLDILAYNTYLNAVYLNMLGSEMFLDTAELRESVVSHAKDLNYVPRSYTSARAIVNVTLSTEDMSRSSVVIPKGTTFTARFGNRNFTFTTDVNHTLTEYTTSEQRRVFRRQIPIYEGYYASESYQYDISNPYAGFEITSPTVDVSSVTVLVVEDNGNTIINYQRATSLFDINATSPVFFLQGSRSGYYEIKFGDGASGRRPGNGATIIIMYRVCSGELPNGARIFMADGAISEISDVSVETVQPAAGGAVIESIESIKFNAPRAFSTQERAVTADDYSNLLRQQFPEIRSVSAFGGEQLSPPQYGRVFIAVNIAGVEGLPKAKEEEYLAFIRKRSPLSITPTFVLPEYTYLSLSSIVRYNTNATNLTPDDLRTIILTSVMEYSDKNLNDFGRSFRYSRLLQVIDAAHVSIISNETSLRLYKTYQAATELPQTFTINFSTPLSRQAEVTTTPFTYRNRRCVARSDGENLNIYVDGASGAAGGQFIETAGIIDYDSGQVNFRNFPLRVVESIRVYVTPRRSDITAPGGTILLLKEDDIDLTLMPTAA